MELEAWEDSALRQGIAAARLKRQRSAWAKSARSPNPTKSCRLATTPLTNVNIAWRWAQLILRLRTARSEWAQPPEYH